MIFMRCWREIMQILLSLNHSRQRLSDDPLPTRINAAVSRHEEAAMELRKVIQEMLDRNDNLFQENEEFKKRPPSA
jgi:hypothetical protein